MTFSKNLYIVGHKGQGRATDLVRELNEEIPFIESEITGWLKLPYHQREKFMKRYWERDEEVKNMKSEIESAIQNLENNEPSDPKPNQNNPTKTDSPNNFPWKWLFLLFLLALAIGIVIFRKKKK